MPARLLAPLQALHAWLDQNPAARLAVGLVLFAAAVALPLPGWLLDAWVLVAVAGSVGLATLIVAVGHDLSPGEVLATVPGFLRRFLIHKLALSVALLKAVLTGSGAGCLLDWMAQGALLGHAGVGLVGLIALTAARLSLSGFPFPERLDQARNTLTAEVGRVEALGREGRLSPRQVVTRAAAMLDELQLLAEGRQIFRLLRAEAWLAVGVALALLAAVLVSGVVLKGWTLALAMTTVAPYALAEALLTGLPALVVAAALAQWLTQALEEAVARARSPQDARQASEPATIVLELGKELAAQPRRSLQDLVSQVRARLARELGLPLPRLELVASPGLPGRGYRLAIRGVTWVSGEVAAEAGFGELIEVAVRTVRAHAGDLLTLEACRAWLDEVGEGHPVTVALAVEAFGLARIQAVLQSLVRERVPVRDLAQVLEALVAVGPAVGSDEALLAAVRRRLSLVISLGLADPAGTIRALVLAGDWGDALSTEGQAPTVARELTQACRAQWATACGTAGGRVALVVPATHRARVAAWLQLSLPDIAVVATDELSAHHGLQVMGTVHRHVLPGSTPPIALLKVAAT
ncbi:MAG: FHIPEP family type III secretion protein [Candidatus Sericytochromatia bacterium]|nr:FHIPEP family type III secretion protein [Candidatus Sericytochromatia bacterium]